MFLLFMATMFGIVGVYIGYFKGFKKISEWSLFGKAEKKRINQLRDGSEPVIIEGTAKPTEQHGTIKSELTGVECLVYQYRIQEEDPTHDEGRNIIENGSDGVPFYIEGEHDSVYVEPQNASVSMEQEYENSGDVRPEKLKQSSLIGPIDISSYDHIEYIQKEISVGEKAVVVGKSTDTRMDADFRIEETGDQLVISDADPSSTQKRLLYKGIILTIFGGIFSLASLAMVYIVLRGIF